MTAFLINPKSAGGNTGSRRRTLEKQIHAVFGARCELLFTERQGHATELAAALAGRDLVVAVGGDGTANEVVNGLATIAVGERPAFGVLPAGTGSDLVKTVGMPKSVPRALEVLRDGPRKMCDWIQIDFEDHSRYCINVAGFGMAGAIVAAVNEGGKRFGGRATFALATARVALGWKPPETTIEWEGPDGSGSWTGKMASTFVANGAYCGGGMWVGAGGAMSDGVLEMTIIPDQPILATARHARRLYTGTMREAPGVVFARVTSVRARSTAVSVLVDVDGEQPGRLPVSMEVEPGVLAIIGTG